MLNKFSGKDMVTPGGVKGVVMAVNNQTKEVSLRLENGRLVKLSYSVR